MMYSCLFFLVAFAVFAEISAKKKFYRVKAKYANETFTEDVEVDTDDKTTTVTVGNGASKHAGFIRTQNLHDYEKGYMAYKDVKGGKCFVARMAEKFPTSSEIKELKSGKLVVKQMRNYIYGDTISNDDLEEIAGSKIAEFCRTYDTYMLQRVGSFRPKRALAPAMGMNTIEIAYGNSKFEIIQYNNI